MEKFRQSKRKFDLDRIIHHYKMVPAMEAFVIANTTLIIGMFVYQFVNPSLLLVISQFGLDLSVIYIGIMWATIISDPVGMGILVLGWMIAGVYIKKKYGEDSTSILLRGSTIPVIFILVTVGLILLTVSFDTGLGFTVLLLLVFIVGALFAFSVILSAGGIILAMLIGFDGSVSVTETQEPDFLVLPVVPEDEKIKYCPFRSHDPGCSYLGYRAPDKPLICDYRSTYLRCRVYAHIYEHLEDDAK